MWSILGIPTTKYPMDVTTFALYLLPPLLSHFAMAVLVITPQTRYFRVALWPVVALLALRAVLSMVIVYENSVLGLAMPMMSLVTDSLSWALAKEPLVRRLRPANSTPSTLMDAFDLVVAYRGYGWNWSHGLHVPRETRPSSRVGFISHVALSAVAHAITYTMLCRAMGSFSPIGLGSFIGGSIFDATLPFYVRYLRSSVISIICCLASYSHLQICYDLCTLIGVGLLRQDPAQWPPGFDGPWHATSLNEFWGRRWHQWMRQLFLVQGGYPLSFVFGRVGLVIGAFLASGMYHYIMIYSIAGTTNNWEMFVGFGMMGMGVLAERVFKRLTGKKVCGKIGKVWMVTWLLLWGNLISDGFVRAAVYR